MKEILIIAIIVAILGSAIFYIISQKKKGAKCIGCPHCGNCQGGCH